VQGERRGEGNQSLDRRRASKNQDYGTQRGKSMAFENGRGGKSRRHTYYQLGLRGREKGQAFLN